MRKCDTVSGLLSVTQTPAACLPCTEADLWGPAPHPYFWQGQVNFFTLYTMSEKIFLKLNLDFIVAEIRGVFGSVGVYACV